MSKFLISVIDDSSIYCAMIEYVLTKTNKNIVIKSYFTTQSFIEDFENKPNIIILDHKFIDCSGLDELKMIKSMHKKTPIIIFSNQEDLNVVIEYMNRGAFDYIVKNDEGLKLLDEEVKGLQKDREYPKRNILSQIYRYFKPKKETIYNRNHKHRLLNQNR